MKAKQQTRIRRALAIATVAVLQIGIAGVALATEQTRTLTQSFPARGTEMVRLANLVGHAWIKPGSGSEIQVTATIHVDVSDAAQGKSILDGMKWVHSKDHKGRSEMALSYPLDRYTTYRRPGAMHWGQTNTRYMGRRVKISGRDGLSLYADLEILVPTGSKLGVRNAVGGIQGDSLTADLDLDTSSGDVDIAGVTGNLSVDTGSGDVAVGTVQGSLVVDTGSGDVVVQEVNGEKAMVDTGSGEVTIHKGRLERVYVDTGSGDVDLRDIDAAKIGADTGSGDVYVSGPMQRAREMSFDTGSGDVRIRGGADASFRLVADQGSGDLRSGYSDTRAITKGRYVIGYARGEEQTQISVDTGSGDCTIEPL